VSFGVTGATGQYPSLCAASCKLLGTRGETLGGGVSPVVPALSRSRNGCEGLT
jgi:hypothetical protein